MSDVLPICACACIVVGNMCNRAGVLVGWDTNGKRALVTRGNCDSWTCPECAKRKRDNWSLRAQIGIRQFLAEHQFIDFVTLTSHEKLPNFIATERVWRAAWTGIYNAIKRRNADFQYLLIPERHKNGRMHVHALWTAGVGKRTLKSIVRPRGLGYMLDVSHISSPSDAIRYVVKYLSKDLGEDVPDHFHRVRVSQRWPEIPAPSSATSNLRWEYTKNEQAFWIIVNECQEKRISMIDAKTSAVFDANDIDFSLIQ